MRKKVLSLIMAVIMAISIFASGSAVTTQRDYSRVACGCCAADNVFVGQKGHILANEEVSIFDALEILKALVGMDGVIAKCANSKNAALIVSTGTLTIFDALEILKKLVGMENEIDNKPCVCKACGKADCVISVVEGNPRYFECSNGYCVQCSGKGNICKGNCCRTCGKTDCQSKILFNAYACPEVPCSNCGKKECFDCCQICKKRGCPGYPAPVGKCPKYSCSYCGRNTCNGSLSCPEYKCSSCGKSDCRTIACYSCKKCDCTNSGSGSVWFRCPSYKCNRCGDNKCYGNCICFVCEKSTCTGIRGKIEKCPDFTCSRCGKKDCSNKKDYTDTKNF